MTSWQYLTKPSYSPTSLYQLFHNELTSFMFFLHSLFHFHSWIEGHISRQQTPLLMLHQSKRKGEKIEKEKQRKKRRGRYGLKNGVARSREFNEMTRPSLILREKTSSSARLRASYFPISTSTLSFFLFVKSLRKLDITISVRAR